MAKNCGNQEARIIRSANTAIKIENGLLDSETIITNETASVTIDETNIVLVFWSFPMVDAPTTKNINAGQIITITANNTGSPKDPQTARLVASKAVAVNVYLMLNFNAIH